MQVHKMKVQLKIKIVKWSAFEPFPKGYISGTDIKESRRKNRSKSYWASIFGADFGNTNSNNNQCTLISEVSCI